jgi:hypothetical protein
MTSPLRSLPGWFLLLALVIAPVRGQGPPEQPVPPRHGKLALTIDAGRHNAPVERVFCNPADANQLITLADDGAIRLWDVAEARTTKVLYPPGVSEDRQHPFLNRPWVVESFPVAAFAAEAPAGGGQ